MFANCPGIEQIEIPDTVTEIQDRAFYNCKNLQSIKLSDSVTNIGDSAFDGCTALTEIAIPDSVTSIGYRAFCDCSKLSNVTLSKGVIEIEGSAFGYCDALTSIEIPKSLEKTNSWNGGVFKGCNNLKTVTFEKGITRIANDLFANCPGIEQIEIPDTVKEIQNYAFYNCKNLRSIKLAGSVTSIEAYAFSGCTALTEALIPNSVSSMGTYVFDGCTSLQKVTLPDTRVNITDGTFRGCSSLKTLEIPDSVQYIRKYAFQESGLTNITLPDGLLAIEESAFRKCANLGDIVLPDRLTSIGTYCFEECDKLGTVTFGSGLTQIPTYAFNLCQSLEKVELPYRMQTVAANAFTNCTSLKEVTVPRSTTSIATNSFSYPKKMTIYGISGTYAETYANSIGATFVNKEVAATKVQLSETDMTLNIGKTATLVLTVTPQNFTDEVAWKSSNTDVATVNDAGVVTAKAVGTATIRVTVGNVSASCKVTVKQPVTSIYLNRSSLTLEGGETSTLTVSVYPSNADNKNVEWSSSDEKVATVDQNGLVTAVGKGSATVTAAAADGSGVKGTCTVTVTSNNIYVTDIADFASTHPYENNCADSWIYTKSGAAKLEITFSDDTEVEDEFDYIFVYDKAGKEVGKYTGSQLAGKSVTVDGDTVRIKLVSDGQGNTYGFRVTKVEEIVQPVEEKFTDVPQGAWYVSAVQYAYDNGIMTGKTATTFAPNANLTRAEFATVLYSQAGKPAVTYRPIFKDVAQGAWYTSSVLWAYDNGIVSGYANGSFGTSDKITREQLALMMYKYAQTKGYDTTVDDSILSSFSDEAAISSWARKAIQWATSHGIMSGKGKGADGKPLLDPKGNATRAECAAMIKKLLTME